ncbi:MAG: hypothetical protein ACK576_16465, partial [Cyclobacteriaceae bacterium]
KLLYVCVVNTDMNTENDKLSPQQSLELIQSMINQAKGNVRDNSFYYLLWGWVLVATHLGSYALHIIEFDYPHIVWLSVIPAWIVSFVYGRQQAQKKHGTTTHLERVNISLWICFGVLAMAIPFFGGFINYQNNPVILITSTKATFVSGIILRFWPLRAGGVLIFVIGLASFFFQSQYQSLLAATAIVAGYLVPGYILKNQR